MIVALFGDVHGNLPALELFFKQAEQADLFISLGDVVNYAPWSNECVQLLGIKTNIVTIRGNHEQYFLEKEYGGKNIIAKTFFEFCIKDFSENKKIEKYIEDYRIEGYYLAHTMDNRIIFSDTEIEISQPTIIAHSHKQFITKKSGYDLINPGSIGQNRKNIDAINFMIWDTDKKTFDAKEIIYDADIVINEMKARQYPEICIQYYLSKKGQNE
jgi:predicted phosphodiesterase